MGITLILRELSELKASSYHNSTQEESYRILGCRVITTGYNPVITTPCMEFAYKIANKRFSEGDEAIMEHFKTRPELTDLIKAVVEESDDKCPSCRKWEEE